MTMILGKNGSGKTTIIECLKLMSCGELPVNSLAGKNFINDPSLSNATETRANVKLMFKAVNGKNILASR
jgi:DNA repair protein RAD50